MARAQSSTLAPDEPAAAARPAGGRGALFPIDAELIHEWALRADGWAPSSVERAGKRVRALARVVPGGLLQATQRDVVQFAESRARARGCEFATLLRTESWAKTARDLAAFYRWLESRKLIRARDNPMRGMRRLPPVPGPAVVSARLARHYDALLRHPDLGARDRALLLVLAHGLAPTQAVRLRPTHVDAEGRLLWVVGPRRRPRVLPLSDYAAEVLGAWAEEQARRGGEWLFEHAPRVQGGLLRLGRRPAISVSFVHEIMRAAVTHAFPLPQQRALRRRLTAGGLADLYRIRLVGSRLPVHLVVELLGVDRVSHLRRYTTPVTLARLHREWRRLIARRRWI